MFELPPILLILAGLVSGLLLGAALGALWSSVRLRTTMEPRLIESAERVQRAESTAAELRKQTDEAKSETGSLREHLSNAERDRAVAVTRAEDLQTNVTEQRALLAQARQDLADTFKALSGDALKTNNEAFLDLARTSFATLHAEAAGDLAQRQQAVDALVKPLHDTLLRYEEQIRHLEGQRQTAYGGLDDHLQRLRQETSNLSRALRAPTVRGRWGEISLRRVVELAGLAAHCDFVEQESVEHGEGRLRPDLVVRLPGGRCLVVDAKTVLGAYLDAHEAEEDDRRRDLLTKHAAQVRAHMDALGAKAYWNQFPQAPEFVVLYLPGDHFLAAALEHDPTLIEDGFARRVILATPTTLVALLHAVAYGWRQEQLGEHAQQAGRLGKELYERMAVLAEHLSDVGQALGKSVQSYNKAMSSLESRVFPAARRFKELGVTSDKDVVRLDTLDVIPRPTAQLD